MRGSFAKTWALVEEDIETKDETVIDTGNIGSATASRDGTYVIYNKRSFKIGLKYTIDELYKKLSPISIDLPGVVGELSFSHDSKWIFFSQFLADTNKDGRIDGNDHGVIYRIAFDTKGKRPFPRQLTSISDNCNFPKARKFKLTITCSAQGTLDIFEIPLGGQVPDDWSRDEFRQAIKAARRYSDRMLIVNNFQLRFKQKENIYYEELFSDYLLNGSLVASIYTEKSYKKSLLQIGRRDEAEFYESLVQWVKVKSKYQTEEKIICRQYF